MAADSCQFTCNSSIDILHQFEISREEDIEIALMHEWSGDSHVLPFVSCLDYRCIEARDYRWQLSEI